MLKNGAQILIEQFKAHGVEIVFGYPGASVLPVYDALYFENDIKTVTAVSENGAVFMADGYARASRKTGVCMATSGPGATNLVTGIAAAFADSIPLVIVTGNVSLDLLGHDAFQEVDTAGITMPVTKYNYIVKSADELSDVVAEAFMLADSGRKGPVLIDIPFNVFNEQAEYFPTVYSLPAAKCPNANELTEAVNMINEAERPVIYAGGGVTSSGASRELISLSEKLNAPVAVSMTGLGTMPAAHLNYIGIDTAKNIAVRKILRECDLLISLGARFSNKALTHNFSTKNTKLLHLDVDRAEIDKNLKSDARILGDLSVTLPLITKSATPKGTVWLNRAKELAADVNHILSLPEQWINAVFNRFGANQLVVTDVGQHQLWTANYYKFARPSLFISSCGLGAMGYGTGAAAGAYFATGKPVVLITGDGGFNMNLAELLTIKKYSVPVCVFIMNNGCLGMIRELQKKRYGKRYIASDIEAKPDYAKIADGFGIKSYKAASPDELAVLLNGKTDFPVVFDCRIKKDEVSF